MKKNCIVSGCSSGIGKAVAEGLTKDGYTVFGIDKAPCSTNLYKSYIADVGRKEELLPVIERIRGEAGHINAVVHAAGIFCVKDCNRIGDTDISEWEKVISVNLTGTFLLEKAVLPFLDEKGSIINFSSEQTTKPQLKNAPYAVSKSGVELLTKILAKELLPRKIRVNAIALASVKTNFIRHLVSDDEELEEIMLHTNAQMPLGLIYPTDVYELVKYLLREDCKITGQTILMDSGVTVSDCSLIGE